MLKSISGPAALALAAVLLLAISCCVGGRALGAEGPPQVNAEFLKKAQDQSDAVVHRLQSLADRDGKPRVALVVVCGDDKDLAVNDRLHWLRDQFETALKGNFTAALTMELVPGLTVAAPADLRGANVRNQLGTEQLDEVLLVTLRRDIDGGMVGAGEWFDVRDPSAAPFSLCSVPIGQGWALGQNDQWQNLKYNVPTLSLQLVAILGQRYADAWEKRPFTTFSIVGALTQPDIESLRKSLAGPRGAAQTVIVTKRKDPKSQEDLLQFRVPAAVDTLSTFSRLKRQKPALELLESDRTHATFTLTQSPVWYELTNPKGDSELRKQVNHLPIAQDRVAIILDSPGLNAGRNPQLNAGPGDARAVGGANVSDIMNALGDELTASCSGVQIVDPGAAAANLRALLSNKELAATQQFTFAWKVSLHESVDKKGQFELGLSMNNLQTQTNIGSASWPRPASQENDGVKIDATDAHQIARYLTGQTLDRMLSADARKSVMLVYLKSGTYDETRDVINAVQKSNLNVEVKQFGYKSGMGYLNLYYAATNPTEVANVVQVASGDKYQVSTLGPGVLELVKKNAPVPALRRGLKATYAVLVSVTKDGCREDESLLGSPSELSAVRTLLSGPCQFNEDQILTLCTGTTSGAGEPASLSIKESFNKPPHSDEVSLFYFSGHVKSTLVGNSRQWNLVPSDYQGLGTNDTLVPIDSLFQKIAATQSKEKFVLIDCYLTSGETGPDDAEAVIKVVKQLSSGMNVLVLCHRNGDPNVQRLPDLLQAAMTKTPKSLTVEQLVEEVKQTHGNGAAQPDNLGATASLAGSNVLFVVSVDGKQQ